MTETENLAVFSELLDEELIGDIDFEFCRFLLQMAPDIHESVLMAACLTSAAYQNGNVCITLENYAGSPAFEEAPRSIKLSLPGLNEWETKLRKSLVVGSPGDFKPLILDDAHRLYLHKLWHYEQNLMQQIVEKVQRPAPETDTDLLNNGLNRLFGQSDGVDWQKVTAFTTTRNLFTVISGGPGTGKTTTVVRLLALLIEQGRKRDDLPTIALAAPTGKAASRLETSIREAKQGLTVDEEIKEEIPVEAVTIHQLLGARRHTAQFNYNKENPLPYDCLIIDEVSMVDQALMSRLMDALLLNTRLVLLGDKDQLASVEAGSVLGDICGDGNINIFSSKMSNHLQNCKIDIPEKNITADPHQLTDHIILLQKSYRFGKDSGISQLAEAVNAGEPGNALALLEGDRFSDIAVESPANYETFEDNLFKRIEKQFESLKSAEAINEKLKKYQTFKILAAHRKGPWGVKQLNARLEQRLQKRGFISPYDQWYDGRPIIINTNDYSVGLSNGDLGVCAINKEGKPVVCFMDDNEILRVSPSRLPTHSTAFAMTVHKSQGSEFDEVYLVLPDKSSQILSRELLYTAITRARAQVKIFANKKVVANAIKMKVARNSGLKDFFWK